MAGAASDVLHLLGSGLVATAAPGAPIAAALTLWWAGDALRAGLAVIEITPDVSPSDVLWLAGCPWVLLAVLGAVGDRARAFAPWWIEPQAVRVYVLAPTDVLDGNLATAWTATPATPATPGLASSEDERHLLEAVRTEAGRADVVVVFPHRGARGPRPRQRPLLSDPGAVHPQRGHDGHRRRPAGVAGGPRRPERPGELSRLCPSAPRR